MRLKKFYVEFGFKKRSHLKTQGIRRLHEIHAEDAHEAVAQWKSKCVDTDREFISVREFTKEEYESHKNDDSDSSESTFSRN